MLEIALLQEVYSITSALLMSACISPQVAPSILATTSLMAGNLAANTISYLNLTTTAGNTINCNDNEFNGVIDPTSEPLAQGFLHAIRISTAAAIDTINILRNNITSGASGIFVDSPSADGIKVNCNYNTVYLTSTASGGAGAQGIHIGETT